MGERGEDGVGEGVGERGEDEKIVILFLLSEKKNIVQQYIVLMFQVYKTNLYVLICY